MEIPKKLKIFVGVNTLTSIDTEVYGSHSNFWYYNGKTYPDFQFIKFHPRRLSIDHMRNKSAELALAHECDYLMFVDDDVIIEKDTLTTLLSADKDVVMGLTYIRGYPFNPMLFKSVLNKKGVQILDHYHDFANNVVDGLVECAAVGFSCVLIKCDLLKKVRPPYFITGTHHTEDIYFCVKAKREVDGVSIFTDVRCPTQHLLDKQAVGPKTVEALRGYYEALGFKKEDHDIMLEMKGLEAALNQFEVQQDDAIEIPEPLLHIIGAIDNEWTQH